MNTPQTLRGFRDFLPADAIKRQSVIQKIIAVFERFGYDPLETPALEYAQTLMGKYGDEADKLLYLFEDNGKRKIGLRYDQTVPFSRVIAQYAQQLPVPFKRYQIQPVWRAENTQKGRFREFLQCDIDTVGADSPLADAEIADCILSVCRALGLPQPIVLLNDRMVFDALGLGKKEIIVVDKLEKIGKDAVVDELTNFGRTDAEEILTTLKQCEPSERLRAIMKCLSSQGYKEDVEFRFDPFLARGLDYYTSTIFELKIPSYPSGSLAGGGRYDTLIGSFSGKNTPAVGVAFGFDRLIEALTELNLLPTRSTATQVLVTVFNDESLDQALQTTTQLRNSGINTDVYFGSNSKLDKQLKYADRKGIPYVIIAGPEENSKGMVKLKNMQTKLQEELSLEVVIEKLNSN